MTTTVRRVYAVLLISSVFFSLTACVLRIYALGEYEPASGYFRYGSFRPQILYYFLFFTVLFFLVSGLYLRGKMALCESKRGIMYYSSNALLGASLTAFALFAIPQFFGESMTAVTERVFLLLSICFALLSAFYCIHNCLTPGEECDRRILLGLTLPMLGICRILYGYFSTTSHINDPNKLLDQFAFAFTALYFLYELRVLFGQARYGAQCTLGMIAMVFTAAASVPSFVYSFWRHEFLSDNAAHDILMLAFFIYITVRMVRILSAESSDKSVLVRLIEEAEHPSEALARRGGDTPIDADDKTDDLQLTFDFDNQPDSPEPVSTETDSPVIPTQDDVTPSDHVSPKEVAEDSSADHQA